MAEKAEQKAIAPITLNVEVVDFEKPSRYTVSNNSIHGIPIGIPFF